MEAANNKLVIEIQDVLKKIIENSAIEVIYELKKEATKNPIINENTINNIYAQTAKKLDDNSIKAIYFSFSDIVRFLGGESYEEKLNIAELQEVRPLRKYFYLFNDLNYIFKKSSLSAHEKLNILLYLIKFNLEKGILNCQTDGELLRIGDNNFFESEGELDFFLEAYQKLKEKAKTEENKKAVASASYVIEDCKKVAKTIINAHQVINKHYLENEENRTEADIEKVIEAFEDLEMDCSLCTSLKAIMLNELEKKHKKAIKNSAFSIKKEEPAEKPLTEKEYNEIYKAIMKMYDIEEHKIIVPLTKAQTIYLVSLMFRIKIPEKEIRKSIQNINWQGWKAYQNMVEEFNAYQGKIERNSHITEVVVIRKNIQDYMEGLVAEDQKERLFWQNEIEEELKRLRKILNQDDTYELEEGRKLYRNRLKEERNEN